jgi:NAD(P)-dependent dehydrogenase (short-subunit alcohol dehydrogenase family)
MEFRGTGYWALILGGSSGIGLATAHKLAKHGMNLAIVHRDRKGAMAGIDAEFAKIREHGVELLTFNTNALAPEGIQEVLGGLEAKLGTSGPAPSKPAGRVRLVLHAVALGNLKPLAPYERKPAGAVDELAKSLKLDRATLQTAIDQVFAQGGYELADAATPPDYGDALLTDEDFAQTVYNMGGNLLSWVRQIWDRKMFAADARVIGLTSEGNTVAWRGYAAVAAAKSALESASRAIAREFGPHGIRSNIVQAGITPTKALALIPGSDHLKAQGLRRNPLGRLTTPGDVANTLALLTTDEAAWINGALIRVDGGEHISG